MPDTRQIKKPKKKKDKKKDGQQEQPEKLSKEKRKKLEELDSYIEGVLEEAGEDFLDQFKQVEGE
ncbi:MAG: hypothetical protein PVH87_19905 [Desulfobacteraceae bacterium]|jgi:hypothetical protein